MQKILQRDTCVNTIQRQNKCISKADDAEEETSCFGDTALSLQQIQERIRLEKKDMI